MLVLFRVRRSLQRFFDHVEGVCERRAGIFPRRFVGLTSYVQGPRIGLVLAVSRCYRCPAWIQRACDKTWRVFLLIHLSVVHAFNVLFFFFFFFTVFFFVLFGLFSLRCLRLPQRFLCFSPSAASCKRQTLYAFHVLLLLRVHKNPSELAIEKKNTKNKTLNSRIRRKHANGGNEPSLIFLLYSRFFLFLWFPLVFPFCV